MAVLEGFEFLIITEHEDRLTIYQSHFERLATCERAYSTPPPPNSKRLFVLSGRAKGARYSCFRLPVSSSKYNAQNRIACHRSGR